MEKVYEKYDKPWRRDGKDDWQLELSADDLPTGREYSWQLLGKQKRGVVITGNYLVITLPR